MADSAHDITPPVGPIWDPDPDRLLGKIAASAANSERSIFHLRSAINDVSYTVQEMRTEQRHMREDIGALRREFDASIRKGVVRGTAGAGGVIVLVEVILEFLRKFQ